MADTLNIYGVTYTGVTGIKATDSNNNVLTYIRASGTKTITENGTGIDVAQYQYADVNVSGGTPTLETVTKTYTPSTSQQTETITPGAGYDAIGEVDVTVNAMPTGTEGTPTATKGAVSNHSVSVTPSVTNLEGYIAGGTISGAVVSVSASELVSGTFSITAPGTYNIANYESVEVNIDMWTEQTISTSGAVTQALDPYVLYHFTGSLTSLTVTLGQASGIACYHFDFNCGSTAPSVNIPNTVTMPDGQTFDANKHYEVDILNGYGAVQSWAIS